MAESLVELPDVARLSPRVVRLLGQNPGKFTLQGTNTYLISPLESSSSQPIPTILVDTAEGDEDYLKLFEDTLAKPPKRHISHVLLTHWHHDHVAGLAPVLETLAKAQPSLPPPLVCKLPNSEQDGDIESSISHLSAGTHFTAPASSSSSRILTHLRHSQSLAIGDDTSLQCLHTPGHTTDHLSLLLSSSQHDPVFFSGDNVLGQGTSVFEDLAAYISSLNRTLDVLPASGPARIFPAHGPVIEDGRKAVEGYIEHRLQREKQVVELMKESSPTGQKEDGSGMPRWGVMQLVEKLYASYPQSLYPAAARGLFLHLHKLGTEQRVLCHGEHAGPDGAPPPVAPLKTEYMELEWSLTEHEAEAGARASPNGGRL
ncbi:Metallo-hydrolase/oxidoreductase [Jaminaea rosea]|uniref:Metallo-hydrolase/oxidoreductase n=1 Tax=Jaminaea rosea TaxID=1569628 RepID=A0A316UX97_9BASI|nr:Metallo-hydrolase/oxidoreductase [Jaminaea rosea]PWN29930.1 Metallo-hydrolase/oxidoreductase [Jaminaea rosea]